LSSGMILRFRDFLRRNLKNKAETLRNPAYVRLARESLKKKGD